MYTYVWSLLIYGRNQHNIAIILKLKIKKRKTATLMVKDLKWLLGLPSSLDSQWNTVPREGEFSFAHFQYCQEDSG